jgi:L-ascorbate metabolism protein UlaG (beta-lactamase superfamily)
MKKRLTHLLVSVVFILSMAAGSAFSEEGENGVTIYYKDSAQIELINAEGTRVFIDVLSELSSPATDKDILLITHTHSDHYNPSFVDSFPGKQLFVKEGIIELPDVTIRGLASVHNEGDPFVPEGGTNYIFIVDIGDLRIVHFGDIGQEAFTEEQLTALGSVDIAITQLDNPYSDMDATNKKGFNLMAQVNPRVIIPTHIFSFAATQMAVETWAAVYTDQPSVTISPPDLPEEAHILFIGSMAVPNHEDFNLPKAAW